METLPQLAVPLDHVLHIIDASLPMGLVLQPADNPDQCYVLWGDEPTATLEWRNELRTVTA